MSTLGQCASSNYIHFLRCLCALFLNQLDNLLRSNYYYLGLFNLFIYFFYRFHNAITFFISGTSSFNNLSMPIFKVIWLIGQQPQVPVSFNFTTPSSPSTKSIIATIRHKHRRIFSTRFYFFFIISSNHLNNST